jgi:hypothetical protein
MQVAARPRFTAGVALVGASLVVASTVTPVPDIHLPDVHLPALRTAEVDLAAAVNPLELYSQVLQAALNNVGTLAENAQPGVLIKQLLANGLNTVGTVGGGVATALTTQVPQLVQTAVTQLVAGNVAGATNALLQIPLAVGLPVLPALLNPLQSVANVIKAFTADPLATELLLSGFIAPLISTPAAAATAIQNVIGAVGSGNPMAVVGALLGAPATVVDGLLNGGYGPDLAPLTGLAGVIVKAGGLLSSSSLTIDPNGNIVVGTGGPLAALQQVLQKIATAIAPPPAVKAAAADVASVPSAAAATITLSTGSAAVSVPAKTTSSTEAAADDKAADDKATDTESTASKPEATETTKPAATPASATDGVESPSTTKDSTTKDSTTKTDSTDASDDAKPAGSGADVTTGNKVEPHSTAGSDTPKSGDASGAATTASRETTSGSAATTAKPASGESAKGSDEGAHSETHAHASKK